MSALASRKRIPLPEVGLELTRCLTPDERAELAGVSLPVVSVVPGPVELEALLAENKAFGATVLEGLVMNSLRVGDHTGIQLLGPGDLLVAGGEFWPQWLSDVEFRTAAPARLALFGNDLLGAAYRWPRIVEGLYATIADQLQRLNAQAVICQLPRVDDRVLAMLWLLAESIGQVTPSGVRLPMTLTHETLGALVGGRRPTVTLALRKLTERGAIVHQESGWLLVQGPPQPSSREGRVLPPTPADHRPGRWTVPTPVSSDPSVTYAELRDTVQKLREEHRIVCQETNERLNRIRRSRIRMMAARGGIEHDALKRRSPPSS